MSHRNEDMSFKDMLRSINARLDLLESGGAKTKLNDIRLGDVTLGTERASGKIKIVSQLSGEATLLGKDEDAKWSYSGDVIYGTTNDSPPHVMSTTLTAIEVVVSIQVAVLTDLPLNIIFRATNNSGIARGDIVVQATLPAGKNVWITSINVPCPKNSIVFARLLPFTTIVPAPRDLSVFVRFGTVVPVGHTLNSRNGTSGPGSVINVSPVLVDPPPTTPGVTTPPPAPPPPTDPPPAPAPAPGSTGTVTIVSELMRTSNTMIGWTSVQDQDHTATTRSLLRSAGHINNTHIIGFGSTNPMQTLEGGTIDFSYLDKMFGHGTTVGYFPADRQMCVTMCGSPPYMRAPKTGGPNPMGTATFGLYDFLPPHWSHHDNFATLAAAIVARYPQINALHWWNEGKGYYYSTPAAGSVMIPPGSGLSLAPGAHTNRNWIEGMTDCYNKVHAAVKAVRSTVKVLGPYLVTRSYTASPSSDLANNAFPESLYGAWGYADVKIVRDVMYFLENCVGTDALLLDTKTSTNDRGILPEYQWAGLQKIIDWKSWLRKLAIYDPAKYGRSVANAATLDTWFAEAYTRIPGTLDPSRHAEAVATDMWGIINYVLPTGTACWMRWQPEGQVNIDPATAHSISLWYNHQSPQALQPTEAFAAYSGMAANFGPGTPLHAVGIAGYLDVSAIASDTKLCFVSRSTSSRTLIYNGTPFTLAPYQVLFMNR